MTHEVIMPMLGMAQDTGKLLTWLKKPGDAVAVGDVLFEVETDKSVSEVEAQADGFLSSVQAEAGADVPVGQTIAIIAETPEEGRELPPVAPKPEMEPEPVSETPHSRSPEPEPQKSNRTSPELPNGRILVSPKARRLAAEAGLDLNRLVVAGVPQPFHVADLETLRALPVNAPAASASHVSAVVPAQEFDAFIEQMQNDGGVSLSLAQVVLAFAAAGLRKATQPDHLTLAVQDGVNETLSFADPDRLRLSAISGAGTASDATADMILRDAGVGYVTTVALGDVAQPTLVVARTRDAIHLTLSFPPEAFSSAQAIEILQELTARLAEPMLALV